MTPRHIAVRVHLFAPAGARRVHAVDAARRASTQWGESWRLDTQLSLHDPPPTLDGYVLALAGHRIPSGQVISTAGCDREPAGAVHRALWELKERHAASTFTPPAPAHLASIDELRAQGQPALSPLELSGHPLHPMRWPLRAWGHTTRLRWTPAQRLNGGQPVWVPLAMVGLVAADNERDPYTEVTSTGLAAGPSVAAARHAALAELVERDRIMRAWRFREPLVRAADLRSGDIRTAYLCGRTEGGLHLTVAIRRHLVLGLVGIGSAAHSDEAEARTHAAAEATHLTTLAWLRRQRTSTSGPPRSFDDRIPPPAHPDTIIARLTGDLTQAATPANVQSIAGQNAQAERLSVTLTTLDDPMPVCRVLATGLEPMDASDDCARTHRLWHTFVDRWLSFTG